MNSWKILLNSLTEFQWFIFILGHYLQLPMKTISWRKVTIVSTLKNNSHKYTSFLQANMFSKSGTLQEKYKDSLKTVMENSRRLVNAFSNLYHDASHKSSAHGDADVSFPICCMSSHIFEYETLLECPNFICNFICLGFLFHLRSWLRCERPSSILCTQSMFHAILLFHILWKYVEIS